MKRRAFTKLTGLTAVAITATGFVRFDGTSYKGDCQTTSDILGPFYRPDSPKRDNLVIKGMPGDIVELSGTIRHKDCSTPYKNAKVELWHCDAKEVYDNHSDEYRYRGTTYCDEKGRYKFTTQMPVPYDVGDGTIRPAHFHLMVSAPGYQSLVTQIYFTGDPYLDKDSSSAAAEAKQRTLEVMTDGKTKKVLFDCNMSDRLKASHDALGKIVGKYQKEGSSKSMVFFEKEGQLWQKNEVFGRWYEYSGDNTFEYGGMPKETYDRLQFVLTGKDVKLQRTARWEDGKESKEWYKKV